MGDSVFNAMAQPEFGQAFGYFGNAATQFGNARSYHQQPLPYNPAAIYQQQMLQAQAAKMKREEAQEAAQRQAFYGMYSPQTGGKPWVNPDTGQTVTGGMLDQLSGPLAAFRPAFEAAGPEKGASALLSLMMEGMKPKNPIIVPEGGTAIDQSGKTVFTGPPKQTEAMRNLEARGLKPGTPEYARALESYMTKPLVQQQTSFNNQQETEERKTIGKFYGETFADAQKAGFNAQANNAKLDALGQALERTYTGTGGQTVLDVKKAAKAVGIDVENVAEGEVGRAIGREMALQLRNPAGGAGMPGAMSDADRDFLASMVPGLSTTKEGNALLVEYWKRINNRNIEVAKIMRDYRKKHGSVDEGLFDELSAYSAKNPLFKPEDFDNARRIAPPPQTITPEAARQELERRRKATGK